MLESGFAKPWPDALYELTGSSAMNADSLLTYFKPLSDWLEAANTISDECIGWETNCESQAKAYMEGEYENITDANQAESV